MRALTLSALLLSGCSSVAVGPIVSATSGLGYDRASYGAQARAVVEQGRGVGRLDVRALSAEKAAGGEGWAVEGEALAGWRYGRVALLAGADFVSQDVETYRETVVAPRLELAGAAGSLRWGLFAVGPSDKIDSVLGVRAETATNPSWTGRVERVDFYAGTGLRAAVGALWRF